MIIGVPKEIKDHETRVGLVPHGVTALREAGHEVLVETRAGEGSSLTDQEYMRCRRAHRGRPQPRFGTRRPGGEGEGAAAVRICAISGRA